jgi:hypothetical protein
MSRISAAHTRSEKSQYEVLKEFGSDNQERNSFSNGIPTHSQHLALDQSD